MRSVWLCAVSSSSGGPPHEPRVEIIDVSGLTASTVSTLRKLILVADSTLCCHQAYAPLNASQAGRQVDDRLLLVFGCSQPGCGTSPAAWRALRCQLETSPPQLTSGSAMDVEAASRHPHERLPAPTSAPGPSEWGDGAQDAWGAGFSDPPQTSSGSSAVFEFADLDAALDKVAATAPKPSTTPSQQPHSTVAAVSETKLQEVHRISSCTAEAGPGLPAFYLHAAPEPARAADPRLEPSHAAHVAELLRRYKEEEGQVPATRPTTVKAVFHRISRCITACCSTLAFIWMPGTIQMPLHACVLQASTLLYT